MNPSSGENARFEQPGAPAEQYEPSGEQSAETGPATVEAAPSKQTAAPAIQLPADLPVAPQVNLPAADDQQADTTLAAGTDSAPSDRIERQWIDKAKSIVAETHDDPYAQKNAMSKVKSEYIKSRFNKTLPSDSRPA